MLAIRMILMTEMSGPSNRSNLGVLYQGLPTLQTIFISVLIFLVKLPQHPCFLHGFLMPVKGDSYISKLYNLIHVRLEAVNSSRNSPFLSYPEYKSVILKVTSPIPAGLLRSPSFYASSLLLPFRNGNGTGNRSREQMLRKATFT